MESDKYDKQNPSQLNRESTILLIWGESDRNRPGGQKKFSKTERSLPKSGYFCSEKLKQAPLAQQVVAVVLHTTGHRFDPCRVHEETVTNSQTLCGRRYHRIRFLGELSNWLAQQTVNLSRKPWGFESLLSHTGLVAQRQSKTLLRLRSRYRNSPSPQKTTAHIPSV